MTNALKIAGWALLCLLMVALLVYEIATMPLNMAIGYLLGAGTVLLAQLMMRQVK